MLRETLSERLSGGKRKGYSRPWRSKETDGNDGRRREREDALNRDLGWRWNENDARQKGLHTEMFRKRMPGSNSADTSPCQTLGRISNPTRHGDAHPSWSYSNPRGLEYHLRIGLLYIEGEGGIEAKLKAQVMHDSPETLVFFHRPNPSEKAIRLPSFIRATTERLLQI